MARPLDYYSRLYPPPPTRFAMGVPIREDILDALLTEDGEAIVAEDGDGLSVEGV